MEDPERLSRLYMFAIPKHQVDVLNFNKAEHIEGNHPRRPRHSSTEKKATTKTTVLD
jgi:hypothetical protein